MVNTANTKDHHAIKDSEQDLIWGKGHLAHFLHPVIFQYMLAIEYHVHVWQVSPQFSCGDTCKS